MPKSLHLAHLEEPTKIAKSIYLQSMINILNSRDRVDLAERLRAILKSDDEEQRVSDVVDYINSVLRKINISLEDRFHKLLTKYDEEIFFPLNFSACGSLITQRDIELIRVCTFCSKFFLAGKKKKRKECCSECMKDQRGKNVKMANRVHQGKKYIEAKELENEFYNRMNFHDPYFDPGYKEKFVNFKSFMAWYGFTRARAKREFRKRYVERFLKSKFKEPGEIEKKRRLLKYQLKWDI